MSADGDDGPGRREVAHRLFAAEFDDATVSYAESDEERAPKYVVTPTGARVNRLFAAGVLTEVESVNEDVLRARVVDYTGAFVSYAGQYQPDAAAFFERHRSGGPSFVALTGKARTFQPEDGDRIYTSVRPESVSEVDAATRDRWTVSAAEATLRRVATMAAARSMDERGDDLRAALTAQGHDESVAAGVAVALDRYGTTVAYLDAVRRLALDALEVVAGERDAVRALETAPDDAGTTSLGPLPESVTAATGSGDATPTTPADDGEPTGSGEGTPTASDDGEPTAAGDEDAAPAAGGTDDAATAPSDAGDDAPSETAAASETDPGTVATETDPETAATETDPETAATETDPETAATETDPAAAATEGSDTVGSASEGLGDFEEDDLYELDEEERREVEESFDVGFESGTEVDDPGEADIDVPGPEDLDADGAAAEGGSGAADAGGEAAAGDEGAASADDGTASGDDDADLEAVAVETIDALDDGDGADREAVVAAVVEDRDADPGAVDDAIEDALLSGKCYEPSEDRLKAI